MENKTVKVAVKASATFKYKFFGWLEAEARRWLNLDGSKAHGLRWWVGCQHGISTDAFRDRVTKDHGDSAHGQDYVAAITYVESHPGLIRVKLKSEVLA